MNKKIVFVCTGNTCRSPMAEALFKDILKERDGLGAEFSVFSAGIYAYEGDPAAYEAIDAMKEEFGIDISSHRARVLDDQDIREAYIILVMTRHHREMILELYPEAADKVYTLKEYAGEEGGDPDICDPFGGDYEVYKGCSSEIEAMLLNAADRLESDLQ
ncbi:MAG TPA: low molecular weight protein arginine phosphatase [Ruminiclostridium sp.]|nr:low molecular weight protein arginine phosphatase [Ruminiclostridium sp.]